MTGDPPRDDGKEDEIMDEEKMEVNSTGNSSIDGSPASKQPKDTTNDTTSSQSTEVPMPVRSASDQKHEGIRQNYLVSLQHQFEKHMASFEALAKDAMTDRQGLVLSLSNLKKIVDEYNGRLSIARSSLAQAQARSRQMIHALKEAGSTAVHQREPDDMYTVMNFTPLRPFNEDE